MRKIIGSLFQSLDGVIQAPGGPGEDQSGFAHGGWVFSDSTSCCTSRWGGCWAAAMKPPLGRRTYEISAAYWPHNGDQPIGKTFNAVRKYIVTSSDRPLTWNNSQRLVGHPAEAVASLKASNGPDLLIQGSSMLYEARHQPSIIEAACSELMDFPEAAEWMDQPSTRPGGVLPVGIMPKAHVMDNLGCRSLFQGRLRPIENVNRNLPL